MPPLNVIVNNPTTPLPNLPSQLITCMYGWFSVRRQVFGIQTLLCLYCRMNYSEFLLMRWLPFVLLIFVCVYVSV